MTTKHEAALREMEEAYQSLVPGTWMNHAEGTLRVCWPTIRDALTAQGEAEKPSDYYDVDVPCSRCGGLGRKVYPNSSTWRGGIGGQTLTSDVCDKCWGSGEEHRPWRSWRELEAKLRRDADLAPSAPRPTHAANVVGTCDWSDCDGETVGVRLDSDAQWLAVCAQHSPVCRAMDAIWRLTCLPFSDNDRHKIQNIALAWIDGTGPREGSAVAQWLDEMVPSAPPASDPDDLPYDDGPEEPWCWGPGSPEHETDQCLHNGWDE